MMDARGHDVDLFEIPDPYVANAMDGAWSESPVGPSSDLPVAPTRQGVTALRRRAVLVALLWVIGFIVAMGSRSVVDVSVTVLLFGVAIPLILASASMSSVVSIRIRGGAVAGPLAGSAALWVGATVLARGPGDDSIGGVARCIMGGTMLLVGPVAVALGSLRNAFATAVSWRMYCLGLATGLLSVAGMRLSCPNDSVAHVLWGHGIPVVFAVGMTAVLGSRLARA